MFVHWKQSDSGDVVNDFNYLEVPFLLFKQINICIRKETETLVKVLLLQYLV